MNIKKFCGFFPPRDVIKNPLNDVGMAALRKLLFSYKHASTGVRCFFLTQFTKAFKIVSLMVLKNTQSWLFFL
jgi:hypothetical protein